MNIARILTNNGLGEKVRVLDQYPPDCYGEILFYSTSLTVIYDHDCKDPSHPDQGRIIIVPTNGGIMEVVVGLNVNSGDLARFQESLQAEYTKSLLAKAGIGCD